MLVTDKQADIAILRTLGASPSSIMRIFILNGVVIGILGVGIGSTLGILLADSLPSIVKNIEDFFNIELLPCDVYYICDFPSDIHLADVTIVSVVAFLLCILATIYPAWRAARTQPAEALRYE